jgi:hypothetical protein
MIGSMILTLLLGEIDPKVAQILEMLMTLDVPSVRDRAPFSKSSKNAEVTKNGAKVLSLKIECHPSKLSSSYGILPSV